MAILDGKLARSSKIFNDVNITVSGWVSKSYHNVTRVSFCLRHRQTIRVNFIRRTHLTASHPPRNSLHCLVVLTKVGCQICTATSETLLHCCAFIEWGAKQHGWMRVVILSESIKCLHNVIGNCRFVIL